MANNFFKIKNGLNLPTLVADPTVTPPANSVAGDMAFYNGRLFMYDGTAWGIKPGSGPTGLIVNADVDASAAIEGSKIVAASGSVSGVVTTGAQTLAGVKTFSSNPTFSAMTTAGIVHNSATTGALTSSLVVDNDVDPNAGIVDTKLATISTAGKVSGSAITSGNISTTGDFTTTGNISTTGTGEITSAGLLKTNTQLQVFANIASEAVYVRQQGVGVGVYIEQQGTANALVVADQASPDTTATVIDASGSVGIGVDPGSSLGAEKLTVVGDVKVTTGDIKLDSAKGIESSAVGSSLNIGTGTNTDTINIGTGTGIQSLNIGTGSNTQTVNIGTGAGVTTINVGGAGDTVNIAGTLTWVNTTNLEVTDKLIAINKGGTTVGANGAGIEVLGDETFLGSGVYTNVASILYDNTTTSKWKLGPSGLYEEVVTTNHPQTLSNKTIGTVIAESGTLSITGVGALKIPVGTDVQEPVGVQGMIRYNTTASAFQGFDGTAWSSIGGATTIDRVTQATHGFVVGDILYMNGAVYAKAKADVAATAEVVGMVSRVISANTFELTICGEVSGLAGLTAGENYFLSAATAGALTATEPSVVGQISLPVGVASSTTTFYVALKRGSVVGGANVRTQIGLSNAATTTVQNASGYDAGSIEGWVYIDGTTDYRFHVRAQFAKNGAASDYNLSYQTTGDTPPAGFSVSITSAGLIQATLPTIAGFASAYINFALNAPAVGATFPLQISPALISGAADLTMQSGFGINFGNETLKNYDEGTWLPRITFGSSSVGLTYGSTRYGHYTRIGNRCLFNCYVILNTKGSSVGTCRIEDLPFNAASIPNGGYSSINIWVSGVSVTNGTITGYTNATTNTIDLGYTPTNANAAVAGALTEIYVSNTAAFMVSGSYIIA